MQRLFVATITIALLAVQAALAPASNAEVNLYLPYTTATSHEVTQGWNGPLSHNAGFSPNGIYAVDFGMADGTPVWASAEGRVVRANDFCPNSLDGCNNGLGNRVDIEHAPGLCTQYAHLSRVHVSVGDSVRLGQIIGDSGQSGYGTGPHLDFRRTGCDSTSQPFRFVEFDGNYDDSAISGQRLRSLNPGVNTPPVSTALIIDSSGSMGWNDPQDRRLAGASAYVSASLQSDEVGVIDFESTATVLSEAVAVGPNRQTLLEAIGRIGASGGTNLGAGLSAGCSVLDRAWGATRAAIFMTDGDGSYSGQAECFSDRGWQVHVVGLGSGVNTTRLQEIAGATGGEYIQLNDATNLVCEFQQLRVLIGGGARQPCQTTDIILQGQSIQLQPTILGPQLQQATFTNIWQGSDIEMTLTSPSGREIDRHTAEDDVIVDVGPTYETFTIISPEAGPWGVSLYGADIPDGGEPFSYSSLVIESDVTDSDGDGVPDDLDSFPNSDMRAMVFVREVETTVENQVLKDGATFNDLINEADSQARHRGALVSAIAELTATWVGDELITGRDAGEIVSATRGR